MLPVARGEAEADWVARARKETVRALQAAVKDPSGRDPEEDEQWDRVCIDIPAAGRQRFDEAIALAGKALRANVPKWERLVVLCQECIGAHATPDGEGLSDPVPAVPVDDWMEPAKKWLEEQSARWAALMQVSPVAVWEPIPDVHADAHGLHEQLRRLASQRDEWDPVFGHLAMLLQRTQAWRLLGFASFGHYCDERLGMSERAVQQRASLERRLYDLPSLRQAMCERRVSYEKARIIARYADAGSLDTWIERAGRMSCVALRAALQGEEEAQMCARGNVEIVVPRHIRGLLAMAFHAVRNAAGQWISPGECLVRIAEHFLEVWKAALEEPNTARKRVLERDLGLCQVWGCTRAAVHVHHIQFRSAGGSDDPTNLVSLCAAHHLQCVHNGWIRVRGKAPDGLYWELGVRPGRAPLVVVEPATASAETR